MTTLIHISWGVAIGIIWSRRSEMLTVIRSVKWRWRFLIAALLIGCAFIPGPLDDFIVLALIAKLAR